MHTKEKRQLYLMPRALLHLYVTVSSYILLPLKRGEIFRISCMEGTLRKEKKSGHTVVRILLCQSEKSFELSVSDQELTFGIVSLSSC